jgi:hypothetical protein
VDSTPKVLQLKVIYLQPKFRKKVNIIKIHISTLESKYFKLSRTKIEYMSYQFSSDNLNYGDVRLDGQVVPVKDIILIFEIKYCRVMEESRKI